MGEQKAKKKAILVPTLYYIDASAMYHYCVSNAQFAARHSGAIHIVDIVL